MYSSGSIYPLFSGSWQVTCIFKDLLKELKLFDYLSPYLKLKLLLTCSGAGKLHTSLSALRLRSLRLMELVKYQWEKSLGSIREFRHFFRLPFSAFSEMWGVQCLNVFLTWVQTWQTCTDFVGKKCQYSIFCCFFSLPSYQGSNKYNPYVSNSSILGNKYASNAHADMWKLKTQ